MWRLQKCVITVTNLGPFKEEDYKTKKLKRKQCFILSQKKISKNIKKNIKAYNEAERLLTARPTEGTGFQTSRHPLMS